MRHLGIFKGEIGFKKTVKQVFSMLRTRNNIMVHEVRSLYGSRMDALEMEKNK